MADSNGTKEPWDVAVERLEQVTGEPMLRFFRSGHLPSQLKESSERFAALACWLVENHPRNAERTVALRKVLEGKDAAVRSLL